MTAAWLKDAVFYEIYPQSFCDSNGDGIGDINGIISKLDYIKDLGCNALWINPCFDSPFRDAGYDVRDYKLVAPRYGTNEDLYNLFKTAHEKVFHTGVDAPVIPSHHIADIIGSVHYIQGSFIACDLKEKCSEAHQHHAPNDTEEYGQLALFSFVLSLHRKPPLSPVPVCRRYSP